jgi:gamma-glutamylcysteine synthetase
MKTVKSTLNEQNNDVSRIRTCANELGLNLAAVGLEVINLSEKVPKDNT